MGSTNKTSQHKEKKVSENSDVEIRQEFSELLRTNLEMIKSEIENVHQDITMMLRGIHAEIQEIKSLAGENREKIAQITQQPLLKKDIRPKVKEITTGLDLLTEIPQHLRRTFQTIMQFEDRGATASQVSALTGKSRPLESDYLNQLSDRGLIYRQRDGKKMLFFSKFEDVELDSNSRNNDSKPTDFVKSINRRKIEVEEASNSTGKN